MIKIPSLNDQFFSFEEKEKLLLITGNYYELLDRFITYLSSGNRNYGRASSFHYDSLSPEINSYLGQYRKEIVRKIEYSPLSDEDREMVKLILLFHILNSSCTPAILEELVLSSHSFLDTYPGSIYIPMIKKYFTIKKKRDSWRYESYIYSGWIIPMGKLSEYFPPAVPLEIEYLWGSSYGFYISGGVGFGFLLGDLKKELFYRKLWRKGDSPFYFLGELLLGYNFWDKEKFGITPFLGIGGAEIGGHSREDYSYYVDSDILSSSWPLVYGIHFDFRGKKEKIPFHPTLGPKEYVSSIIERQPESKEVLEFIADTFEEAIFSDHIIDTMIMRKYVYEIKKIIRL